jgi:hypothetical protein
MVIVQPEVGWAIDKWPMAQDKSNLAEGQETFLEVWELRARP